MRPAPSDPPEVEAQLWRGFTGNVGWDIGANCGQSLPTMTKRFRHVVAFEPAEECYEYLVPWVGRASLANVVISNYALSDVDGQIELAALPSKIDSGQLVTPGTPGMEWSPCVWFDADNRAVEARTADSLLEEFSPPNFLKIDVEGHEQKVLDGARQLISDYLPAMLVEFHTPQLGESCRATLVDNYGYRVEVVRHPHYLPGSPMWHQHGWLRAFPS